MLYKILGVILSNDLKLNRNVDQMLRKHVRNYIP